MIALTVRGVVLTLTAFFTLVLLWGSFFTVDQTELANVRRFGTVLYPKPLTAGFYMKMPLIDTVDSARVTLQTIHIQPFEVLTVDNQKVTIEENFNYTISPENFYHVMYQVGSSGHIDADTIQQQVVPVARDRTARVLAVQNMVTVNASREVIQAEIEKNVTVATESLFGITAHSLQIAAITPSANFMRSIDEATMAKNQAIAAENQLRTKQFEAQQVAATAKGAADATIEAARGQAESRRRTADAEAYARTTTAAAEAGAIEQIGKAQGLSIHYQADAIKDSPNLVEFNKANRWNGALPTSVYAGAPIPFFNAGAGK